MQLTLPDLPRLPALPALPPLPPLPALHMPVLSPWFPLDRKPWQWGYYEIKVQTREHDIVEERRYLWDGREWADKLPAGAVAWRGRSAP